MGGAFRITRAEFLKIFKKPSVYIMGTVLALVILIASLFFEPTKVSSGYVTFSSSVKTVSEVKDIFNSEEGAENSTQYDVQLTLSENIVNFYKSLNTRKNTIQESYSALAKAYTALEASVSAENYTAYKTALANYKTALSFNPGDYNGLFPLYLESSTYTNKQIANVNTVINSSNSYDATQFLTIYKSSKFNEKLSETYSTAMQFETSLMEELVEGSEQHNNSYINAVLNGGTINDEESYINYVTPVIDALQQLKTYFEAISGTTHPIALLDAPLYNNVIGEIQNLIAVVRDNKDIPPTDVVREKNKKKIEVLRSSTYLTRIKTLIKNDKFVEISDETIAALTEKIETIKTRREEVKENLRNLNVNLSVNRAIEYVSEYKLINKIAHDMAVNTLHLEMLQNKDDQEIQSLLGYDFRTFNRYSVKESLLKDNYMFDSNTVSFDYAQVFSFGQNSTAKTTIFDFMFYALRISTLFIIVFAIIMAANLIASEFDTGTIKLLAMRPFRRSKIITGKLMATMFFVIIFVLFSALISALAGLAMFDWSLAPVLAVFNSTVAFSIHPILLMLINIASVIIEIMFFAVIAITFSTLTRSFAGTVTSTLIIYILSLGLNIIFGNALWYSYTPFINVDFFKYLGGAFTSSNSMITALFTTPLLKNMDFFISLGLYGGITILLLILTYSVFKRRDV